MTTRTIKDGPWCWQSKNARRRIREAFDATNNIATALAAYDALCEIASDGGAETFVTTHSWIQRLSGVSVSTIKKHLAVFSDLALVKISTPSLRAPSTYTLLSIANDCPTLGNGELALANSTLSAPLATSEESKKKGKETKELAPAGAEVELRTDEQSPKPKNSRPRNPLIDAIVAFDGSDPTAATRPAFAAAAAALAAIKDVCPTVTPEEIARRGHNYRTHHPEAAGSGPNALAKHWAKCDRPAAAMPTSRPESSVRLVNISE